jgi:hypothetical protein
MKKSIAKYHFLVFIFFLFLSCERDDICPEATPTTPFLIIEFFDVSAPDENKNVQGLSYIAEGREDTINLGITDSILIPLNTNLNSTTFTFIRNTDNEEFTNADDVEFIYEVNEVYINRSCGFKAVYRSLSAIRQIEDPPSDNWIRSVTVEQMNVENEQNTHVSILH